MGGWLKTQAEKKEKELKEWKTRWCNGERKGVGSAREREGEENNQQNEEEEDSIEDRRIEASYSLWLSSTHPCLLKVELYETG